MFRSACTRVLRLSQCKARLAVRHGPLARPVSPRLAELAEKTANRVTGSGLLHSPASHAWYHPAEPPVASRTRHRQSRMWTSASNPGLRPPRRRIEPSGSLARIEPDSSPTSMRSRILWKPPANRRARMPGVTPKRRPLANSEPPLTASLFMGRLCSRRAHGATGAERERGEAGCAVMVSSYDSGDRIAGAAPFPSETVVRLPERGFGVDRRKALIAAAVCWTGFAVMVWLVANG